MNETLLSVGCCHVCQPVGELFAQYSKVYDGCSVLSEMRIKQVLIYEVQRFSGDGMWGGLWQLAAVANFVEQPVQVVYPSHLCCKNLLLFKVKKISVNDKSIEGHFNKVYDDKHGKKWKINPGKASYSVSFGDYVCILK